MPLEADHQSRASASDVPRPSDVVALVDLLRDNDDELVIKDLDGPDRSAWRRVIWQALNLGGLPDGKRLRHSGRDRGDLIIRLVDDTDENRPTTHTAAPFVKVPERTPRRLHPMLATTRARLPEAHLGWVSTRRVDGVVCLDVTKGQLPRVWRVLHALFTEAERRGYEIAVGGDDPRRSGGVVVIINGSAIEISVTEISERLKVERTAEEENHFERWHYYRSRPTQFRPTGRLRVSAGRDTPNSLASDGVRWKVEDRVGRILERLESLAEQRAEAARQAEVRRLEYVAQQEARLEREWLAEIEKVRVADLLDRTRRHHEAATIRSYLASTEAARGHSLTSDEREWLKWAHAHADQLDPADDPLEFPAVPPNVEMHFKMKQLALRAPARP